MIYGKPAVPDKSSDLLDRLERVRQFRDVMLSEVQAFPLIIKRQIIRGVIKELAMLHDLPMAPCRADTSGYHRRMYCEGCGRMLDQMDFRSVEILEIENRVAPNGHDPN